MTSDQSIVEQLQRRLSNWKPSGKCPVHSWDTSCKYDKQGNLLTLHLCELGLQEVPSEVWQFSSLQELGLANNKLSSLPAGVWKLTSLQELDLANNELSRLPAGVWKLTSLQVLLLANNKLSSLPAEMGKLPSLQVLLLTNNKLSSLPAEMGKLPSLRELDLEDNPWLSPFSEIITQDIPAILAYLRAQPDKLDSYLDSSQSHQPAPKQSAHQSMPKIDIFYSYVREDEKLQRSLENHMSGLRSQHLIANWHDRHISAGAEEQQTTNVYLEKAHLILLLVSADFMASEECAEEVQQAMQRHMCGEARVVPIILRPCDWQAASFGKLSVLPSTKRPLTLWSNTDEAFFNVVQGIRQHLEAILTERSTALDEQLQTAHAQMDALRDPYTDVEFILQDITEDRKDLTEQTTAVEAEIAALQQRLHSLQQQSTDLSQKQVQYEQHRQKIQQQALEIRARELAYQQEAQELRDRIDRVKPVHNED